MAIEPRGCAWKVREAGCSLSHYQRPRVWCDVVVETGTWTLQRDGVLLGFICQCISPYFQTVMRSSHPAVCISPGVSESCLCPFLYSVRPNGPIQTRSDWVGLDESVHSCELLGVSEAKQASKRGRVESRRADELKRLVLHLSLLFGPPRSTFPFPWELPSWDHHSRAGPGRCE